MTERSECEFDGKGKPLPPKEGDILPQTPDEAFNKLGGERAEDLCKGTGSLATNEEIREVFQRIQRDPNADPSSLRKPEPDNHLDSLKIEKDWQAVHDNPLAWEAVILSLLLRKDDMGGNDPAILKHLDSCGACQHKMLIVEQKYHLGTGMGRYDICGDDD